MTSQVTLAATVGELLLFPNSLRNSSAGGDRDVWLGSCLLNELRLTVTGTPSACTVTIYDGLVGSTGIIVVGGSTPQRFRVQCSATVGTMAAQIGGLVDATYSHTASSLSADITGLRTRDVLTITPGTNIQYRRPWQGMSLPTGCAVRISIASGTETVIAELDFVPHVSGAFRKKLSSVASSGQYVPSIAM
jgi:hypothetical protein